MARLGAVLAVLMWQQAPIAQTSWPGRGAGPMMPMMEERRIVERFDKDGDRRLNRIEREAARDWLASQPRRGRPGGPNFPAGAMPPPPFGGRDFAQSGGSTGRRWSQVARSHHALIADAVRADTRKLYTFQAFESGVSEGSESLKSFVIRRRAFLLQEK